MILPLQASPIAVALAASIVGVFEPVDLPQQIRVEIVFTPGFGAYYQNPIVIPSSGKKTRLTIMHGETVRLRIEVLASELCRARINVSGQNLIGLVPIPWPDSFGVGDQFAFELPFPRHFNDRYEGKVVGFGECEIAGRPPNKSLERSRDG